MGKSNGSTRGSSSGSPKGLTANEQNIVNAFNTAFSGPVLGGGNLARYDRAIDTVERVMKDFDDDLTADGGTMTFNLGPGFNAMLSIDKLPNGDNKATMITLDGIKQIGKESIVYNPANNSERGQAQEDLRDSVISAILQEQSRKRG